MLFGLKNTLQQQVRKSGMIVISFPLEDREIKLDRHCICESDGQPSAKAAQVCKPALDDVPSIVEHDRGSAGVDRLLDVLVAMIELNHLLLIGLDLLDFDIGQELVEAFAMRITSEMKLRDTI